MVVSRSFSFFLRETLLYTGVLAAHSSKLGGQFLGRGLFQLGNVDNGFGAWAGISPVGQISWCWWL